MHQTGSHLRIDPPFLVAELVKSFGLLEQPTGFAETLDEFRYGFFGYFGSGLR